MTKSKLKTRLLKDLPIKTTPITDDDYVVNTNNGTTKLKVKDITKNVENKVEILEDNISEFSEQLDTIAIQVSNKEELDNAINIIKTNKGGTILIKNDITLFDDSITYKERIYELNALNYFKVIGNNKNFILNEANDTPIYYIFSFKNSKNIDISALNVLGNIDRYPFSTPEVRRTDHGSCLVALYENNENINIENIHAENAYSVCLALRESYDGGLNINKSKNIKLNNISGDSITYPLNFRFNGDNVSGKNLKFNKVHRAYFPYGVKNHEIELECSNFDATGCLLNAYKGQGLENIKLTFKSKDNDNELTPVETKSVQIKFGDKNNATFRNIEIILDVENLYSKVDNVFDIAVDGLETGEEKHKIDGLKLSGRINKCVQGALKTTIYNNGSFDNSTFKNIEINNLEIVNQGANSNLELSPLEGNLLIDNLQILGTNKRLYLYKNDNKDCSINIKNCNCGQITQVNFTVKAKYEDCIFTDDWAFNLNNKILKNTIINGKLYNIAESKDNTGLWWNNNSNIVAYKEFLTDFGNLTSADFIIDVSNLLLGSRYTQPSLFNFIVYFRDSTYGRMGIIKGLISLKSNAQANTYLEYAKILKQEFFPIGNDGSLTSASVSVKIENKMLRFTLNTNNSAINNIGFELRV